VTADLPPTSDAAVPVRQRPADGVARQLPPGLGLVKPEPCLVDRLPRDRRRRLEHLGDLVVTEAAQLAQQERRSLALGERFEVRAKRDEPFLRLQRLGGSARRIRLCLVQPGVHAASPKHVDRLVVGDAEQPWAQRDVRLPAQERLPRVRHRGAHGVEGVLVVTDDREAVGVQRPVLALVDRAEGRCIAAGGQRREGLVAAKSQTAQRGLPRRLGQRGPVHAHSGLTPHVSMTPADRTGTKACRCDRFTVPGVEAQRLPSAASRASGGTAPGATRPSTVPM